MTTPAPPVTDHDDFERRLLELRKREKAHTREGDAIAAARRRLPMTEVPPDTTVIGADGRIPFGDVFEGRDELIVYSHMFYAGQPWEWQCEGCTRNSWPMQHAADAASLNAYGITFAILADGPYEEIASYREFMGYTTPWYSNAHLDDPTVAHAGRIACYLRRDGRIYLTYWTTARGDEVMSPLFGLLDMTAYGRREEWEDSPEGWPQIPTHSFLRTDEHGAPMGPREGGRPVYQWTARASGDHLMSARTYTFDVFSSLDGYGSYSSGDWGGHWGKQGPEFLDRRLALYGEEQRMVLGAKTFRQFVEALGPSSEATDPVNTRMRNLPTTVVSSTLQEPLDWPNATVASGDAVDVVARLKQESEVPLRSHGSLSMNWALMAAGLVDRVQVTLFPVITGQTGVEPIFQGAADFDLELIESRTLDGNIQELIYRPTVHA